MTIICRACSKDLYKADGSGPYSCPSCINQPLDAIDSATGEPANVLAKSKKPVTPKSSDSVHVSLLRATRFGVTPPQRPEPVKMLRLKSKQHKNTTVPLGPVYVRFDQNGVGEVAEHNKQFIDPIMVALPGRFEWLESATDNFVDTMLSLAAVKPSEPKPQATDLLARSPATVEEPKEPKVLKKPKKSNKKDEE